MKTGWQVKRLGEVCEIYQPKTISAKEMDQEGQYVVFGANGPIGRYNDYNHAEPQLLVTCRGATCGSVNVSEAFSWITGNAMVIRPKTDALLLKFVEYFFRGAIDLSGVITGAAQPQITRQSLAPVAIPIPHLDEQKRIVAILDKAFEGLTRAHSHTETNLQNARDLFESTLDFEVLENTKFSMVRKLGDVCQFEGGSQPPKSEFLPAPGEGLVRLIQIRDYKSDAKAVYIPIHLARRFCKADDIMIGRYGPPIFQILRGIEGAYNVALMKAVPNEDLVSKNFLFYFLKNRQLLKFVIKASSRAAGQDGVNKEALQGYPIYLPTLQEQERIVVRLELLQEESRSLQSHYRAKLADLEALRQSLLQKAFAGELT